MIEVSVEAWHAILYLVTPWQYLPRLGMQFYILSRLGSVCRGLVFCSISFHALAVSAEAWHAILYIVTPWQYLPRLGMLFYILSRLGSIRKRTNLQKPKVQKLKLRLKEQSRTAKSQAPKSRATKAHIEQTETCRRAEVRDTL